MQDAQSNKKMGCWFVIGIIIIAVFLTDFSDKNDSHAVSLVQSTQTEPAAHKLRTAPFRGGVAVIANGTAGYWVFNDVVYATNGVAKGWSPDIKYSLPAIDQASIEEAITAYEKDGTVNNDQIGEILNANLNNLLLFSKASMNNKKALSFYLGKDDNNYCDVSSTFDYLKKFQGEIYTDHGDPEFNVTCSWDGGSFILHESWETFAKLIFIESQNAEMNLNMTAELIETGNKGRVLKVTATNIPFDISKAK